jgi:uncharacterized OB-fold protein
LYGPLELVSVSGLGKLYAATVVCRPAQPSFAALVPYSYALVDLDEGIRVVAMITGCPPEAVTAGMRVEATIDLPTEEDEPATPLIFFAPLEAESTTNVLGTSA